MTTTGNPMKPAPPPPKPGRIKVYKALYCYSAQQPDELSFEEGDILYVTDSSASNSWWHARCGGKSGLIPNNYVNESAESINYPLHEAAKRGNLPFLQECLSNQVSANSLDKSGSTALYWAAHSGYTEILKILLAIPNVSISSQNKLGDTALHAAAWKNHSDCVELLLQAGANAAIKNIEEKTPYNLAGNPEAAALLKRASASASAEGYGLEDSEDEYSD